MGRPYLQCVADALMDVCDELVILGRSDVPAARYHAIVPNARILNDVQSQAGPIVAIRAALERVRGDWIIVAPCDAPALAPEDAQRLVTEARRTKGFTVASTPDDILFDLFCGPKPEMEERFRTAKRLQDVLHDALRVPFTAQEGLNINERPQVSSESA